MQLHLYSVEQDRINIIDSCLYIVFILTLSYKKDSPWGNIADSFQLI